MRVALALAVILLAATATAGTAAPQPAVDPVAQAKCVARVVYKGVEYRGLEATHLRLNVGRPVGTAQEPQCDDTPPPCRPGDNCTPQKTEYRAVAVRRLTGIRPRVAIARRDVAHVIYVAVDRCRGTRGRAAFVRCLKKSR